MERLVINGGKALKGSVEINGAKNAAVAILPATVVASKGKCIIDNIPDIEDVHCLERILKSLGCIVNKIDNNTLEIDSSNVSNFDACTDDVRRMRASYYFIGALLTRFKQAKVQLPGGCPIGVRPIDQHIKGFEALGADVVIEHGAVILKADKLVGTNIFFDVVSVGATINVMIAATLAE
ncbi:EPSP synthase (3-phosphoshikimate 1-carboxyvinyltransferase), partial [Clostridium sp. DSM 8431]